MPQEDPKRGDKKEAYDFSSFTQEDEPKPDMQKSKIDVNKESDTKKIDKRSDSTLEDDIDQGGIGQRSPVNLQVSSLQSYGDEDEEDEDTLLVAEECSIPIKALVYSPLLSFEARKKSLERTSQYFRKRNPFAGIEEDSDCTDEFEDLNTSINKLYISKNLKKPQNRRLQILGAPKLRLTDPKVLPPVPEIKKEMKNECSSLKFLPKYFRTCGCSSVLIVDDSPFNLLILKEIFKKILVSLDKKKEDSPMIKIDEASNGLRALKMVKEAQSKS